MGTALFDLAEKEILPPKRELYRRMAAIDGPGVYVLGRNKYAESVAQQMPVRAFIDDHASERTHLGYPIVRMESVPQHALVVSCVVDSRPLTAGQRLQAMGLNNRLDYFDLLRLDPARFQLLDFCNGNREDILEHIEEYRWVYDHLADELSKTTFRHVVQFLATMDLEQMRGFSLELERQYFEDFLKFHSGEVFVDGGGYDGRTTRAFALRAPDYGRIYYFEPMPKMMEESRRVLADLQRIQYVEKGLSDCSGTVHFDDQAGSASRISLTGDSVIEVTTIDEEIKEPVSFIKLDIEGAELATIEGAERQIRAHAPKLAVCIYHNQSDFWRIPRRVLELQDRYRLYVRHYTEGILETVMFFVPDN